jgi:hypothetical protein
VLRLSAKHAPTLHDECTAVNARAGGRGYLPAPPAQDGADDEVVQGGSQDAAAPVPVVGDVVQAEEANRWASL